MAFNTDTILTAGSILKVQKSVGNRTLPSSTITIASGGASTGATSVPVTAVTADARLGLTTGDVVVQQGDKLTFNETTPVTVTLTEDLKVGDTSMTVAPLTANLTAAKIATTSGLLLLLGIEDMGFDVTNKEVSTRSFENGIFDDARKVSIGGNVACKGFYRAGDVAFQQVIEPASLGTDEIYFYQLYPDGRYRSAYAFIKDFKESAKLDDILRCDFSLRVVGTFEFGVVTP